MKIYWGVESDELYVPDSSPPGSHGTGGWVGPTDCLNASEKINISCLYQEKNCDFLVIQPIA
jgi:hypothetical protein